MNGGSTDPESMSYNPAQPQQPGILFSALASSMTPVPQVLFPPLVQLAMGCSNPLYNPLPTPCALCCQPE